MLVSERRAPRLEWVFKPLASACFVALALQAGALESQYGQLLLAGLVLCLLGDLLLIPVSNVSFTAGLGSFLLGHLCYALAFLQLADHPTFQPLSLIPVGMLGALSLRWLWPQLPTRMKLPVVAYVLVICAMLVAAASALTSKPGIWILVGAWGFAISDLSVARNQFVSPGFINRLWGIPLYFASQLMLAATPALL
jgi:uncharacterized membrane protein YhhN